MFATAQTLLDYGCISRIIISDPEQVEIFGEHISTAVRKEFDFRRPIVQIDITSAPPEWDELEIIPSIH